MTEQGYRCSGIGATEADLLVAVNMIVWSEYLNLPASRLCVISSPCVKSQFQVL